MSQEEKELLLRDLCARLPYGVKCYEADVEYTFDIIGTTSNNKEFVFSDGYERNLEQIKPYLRPMSSMTDEEAKIYHSLQDTANSYHYEFGDIVDDFLYFDNDVSLDYLNSIHIDYRGLIPMGLALEAPEGMYK